MKYNENERFAAAVTSLRALSVLAVSYLRAARCLPLLIGIVAFMPLAASSAEVAGPKPAWLAIGKDVLGGSTAKPTTLEGNYVEILESPVDLGAAIVYQGGFIATVFTSGGGKYHFKDYPGDEFVFVQEGRVTVIDDDTGKAQTFQAGDFFLVPKGWKGVWHMPGPYREFVVLGQGWDSAFAGHPVASGMSKSVSPMRLNLSVGSEHLTPIAFGGEHVTALQPGFMRRMTFHVGDYAVMLVDVPKGASLRFSQYPGDKFAHVVSGEATLSDASGARATFAAGDNFITTRAFHGEWKVSPGYRELVVIDRKHLEPAGGSMNVTGVSEPAELFAQRCASCHGGAFAPQMHQLGRLTADEVESALWHEVMQEFANGIDSGQRARLAQWNAGLNPEKVSRDAGVTMCDKDGFPLEACSEDRLGRLVEGWPVHAPCRRQRNKRRHLATDSSVSDGSSPNIRR